MWARFQRPVILAPRTAVAAAAAAATAVAPAARPHPQAGLLSRLHAGHTAWSRAPRPRLLAASSQQSHEPPLDDTDSRDAVLELAPGVGGQEASLFAAELLDMYQRLAEARGWSFEVEHSVDASGGGLQAATIRVSSPGATGEPEDGVFGWLRFESGVHRVQRVPETDRKGRMQTSGAVVVVLPVALESDIDLPKGDLRIDISKKSSGPGGQSVNASNQAVRVTHLPTGVSVHCTATQSQMENRKLAVEMLRTQLLARQVNARMEFERAERKEQRGTGDRSEKIRTYNFQRDEVIDHRLGKDLSISSLSANDVLLGDGLEAILAAHRARSQEHRLEQVQREP